MSARCRTPSEEGRSAETTLSDICTLRTVANNKLERSLNEHRLPGLREYVERTRSIARSDGGVHLAGET